MRAEEARLGLRNGARKARSCLIAVSLCAAFALAGCAASSYAGISLRPGAADAELQELATRARSGDKHAQLELGIRYEEGRGVAVDRRLAERLYRRAATGSGGRTWVYSPPVRNGGRGRAIPIDRGPKQPGLAEAARRLAALRNDRGRR